MKVLFAVSNEEISESIVKKYQKEYKQIISYKNVYYFNAIIKELQKDKSYDRIVISEELEAFAHNQYDQIDKFIFDKLDRISDEASNSDGEDIPVIIISSDRRSKGEQLLVKLFGIGIYNAIVGTDRSIEEVCRLINRPRAKKEAKQYYKIDAEDVNYQSENENDVSEIEIQNIIAHYKRIGKNEQKYIESFDNIAAQYNDVQLRIISKFLPLNVRAVLEGNSPKYQQIMSFSTVQTQQTRKDKEETKVATEKLLNLNSNKKIMSSPVVIPSNVKTESNIKLARPKIQKNEERTIEKKTIAEETEDILDDTLFEEIGNIEKIEKVSNNKEIEDFDVEVEEIIAQKKTRGRPKKTDDIELEKAPVVEVKKRRGRPPKALVEIPEITEQKSNVNIQEDEEDDLTDIFADLKPVNETTLPGIDDIEEDDILNTVSTLPGLEEDDDDDDDIFGSLRPVENLLPGLDTSDEEETTLPGLSQEEDDDDNHGIEKMLAREAVRPRAKVEEERAYHEETAPRINNSVQEEYNPTINYIPENTIDISNLLNNKKLSLFLGTTKNGTSFVLNNVAEMLSASGVNVAILDTTANRNSYYIYTKNDEALRVTAANTVKNLIDGTARGVQVNNNLTVYTSLPTDKEGIENAGAILETLAKNHTVILVDADFSTPLEYFRQVQEIYLVQTYDILTIQPLTAFLRELKAKNILDESKLRIILNKAVKIKGINDKTIIGGMAFYNDPSMSFMTELFDRNKIRYVVVPFDENVYIKYLEAVIECEINLKGYSKTFIQTLKEIANMIYTLPVDNNQKKYTPPSVKNVEPKNSFTPTMNNTLEQMKNRY